MLEKDLKVKRCECDVKEQEVRVRASKDKLNFGYLKLKAEFDESYNILKYDLEKEVIRLERDKASLANAMADAERGFDSEGLKNE